MLLSSAARRAASSGTPGPAGTAVRGPDDVRSSGPRLKGIPSIGRIHLELLPYWAPFGLARADHAVAAGRLGGVQRLVRPADQGLGPGDVLVRIHGHPRGDSHPEDLPVSGEEVPGHVLPHALCEDGAVVEVGIGQDRDELLAAVAAQFVDFARCAPQDLRQLLEHAVAHLVAGRVVALLAAVEVEHHEGAAPARRLGPRELLGEDLRDVAVVVAAGQTVADAELRELEVLLLELLLEALDAEHRADAGLELGEVDRLG